MWRRAVTRIAELPVPEMKSLFAPVVLAVMLGGCSTDVSSFSIADFNPLKGSDPLRSADYNYFYKRDQASTGIVTAAAADPINPRSNQALYFTAGPGGDGPASGNSALPQQVRGGPSGIALQMTECEVVRVAGSTDRVEIRTHERGD